MCLECFVDEHRHEGTPTIQLPTALEIVETQREVQYITTEIQIVELEIPEHLLPRPPAAPRIAPKKANRCFECNRKLGVMGFNAVVKAPSATGTGSQRATDAILTTANLAAAAPGGEPARACGKGHQDLAPRRTVQTSPAPPTPTYGCTSGPCRSHAHAAHKPCGHGKGILSRAARHSEMLCTPLSPHRAPQQPVHTEPDIFNFVDPLRDIPNDDRSTARW
eukprot:CAMPEP_0198723130 /NCGR_PEP_ID=MMETSP1475-20131203/681_1 /TAXON_ID= ORGANISM="Unidentified sp., Strain CCMP1999" /NCGR_SAMPLE_ID=MMETSP1475 /ASSEMBLY_ACC=CAM_ASM_001111 /LENGTH=220 /DNA_ID=CAMNT_0044484145 /DNA_START=285 /DNA_END=946 /DNA_ORIENTATION=-